MKIIFSALALTLVFLSGVLLFFFHQENINGIGAGKENISGNLIQKREDKNNQRRGKEETTNKFTEADKSEGFSQGVKVDSNIIKNDKPSRIEKSGSASNLGHSEKHTTFKITLEPLPPTKIFTEEEKRLVEREFIRMLTGEISGDSWR